MKHEFTQGPWRLVLTYRHPGSRSEGAHGELYRDGQRVEGEHADQTLDTDLGKLQYFGKEEDRLADFVPTGWQFTDPEKRMAARGK